nr:hypothetical protein [Tanacetum cinerariifolium]
MKKVPKKVLLYFSIIPRLQRLYKSSHTAKEMIWHATGKCTEPSKMQHPVDGRAWKNFDTKYLDFAKEPRNVRLGLAADGFNLFDNLSQAYNMWLVILTTYNLPPWLCMKESSFMMTLLIPGPKSLGKDIDVYLRPLIEDLKVLRDRKGVETINVASGQKFNMSAMVLWTINDFPARSSLSGWNGQGYKACPTCNKDTLSVRALSKTVYVGHIRFLKKPHKWRSSREFNGQTDNRDPPKEFGRDEILAQLDRLPTRLTDKIAKPIIELCSLFNQICSATLMDDDMLKAQIKVVDILCDFELIYPPALFDIMIHLVIHLPLEALEGMPILPRCMFPFERYMKKLKGYVRNKAKPEGSIAEGYVAEALTFSSHYFRDVTTKFNRPDRNIRQRYVDNEKDPEVSITNELFALACGPTWTPISIKSYVVDGVRYIVHSCDERRITQNSGICSPGPDEEMYYGKGKRKPNLDSRAASMLNTHDKTRNLSLKEITNTKGPVPIQFELSDKQTIMPLGDHAAHWSRYIEEVIRGVPLYYPSWLKVSKERKAALITNIGTQFDLRPHMKSPNRTEINAGIQQHLQKVYNTNKAAFKAQHWVIDPTTETYNVEKIRREEMRRLEATGTYTDEINRLSRGGKQRGHILGVGRVLSARATASPCTPAHESTVNSLHKKVDFRMSLFKSDSKYSDMFSQFESGGASGSWGCGDDEEGADEQDDEDKDGDGDT